MPRKDIAKDGEKTRFGRPGGPDPRKATKSGCPKHSIRKSVQYLSGKSIAEINDLGKSNEPTVAQLIAAVALKKALKGDMQAIGYPTSENALNMLLVQPQPVVVPRRKIVDV